MATVYQEFLLPFAGVPDASSPPALIRNEGSNFPVCGYAFDAATDESIYLFFRAFNYGSGNITIDVEWYCETETTGAVIWQAQIAAITPNSDSQDIETDALATLNYVSDSHLGSTAQRLHRASITLSNLDSIAAGDWCVIKLTRDADGTNGTDDLATDAIATKAVISYSDT
jgi:hypothetical protein